MFSVLDDMPEVKALIEKKKIAPSFEERLEALEQLMLDQILIEEDTENV